MKALALAACLLATPAVAASGVSDAALAAAGKQALMARIDPDNHGPHSQCPDRRTVGEWLQDILGNSADPVRWTGGPCLLSDTANPFDSGASWCAQGEIQARRTPATATIEISFDPPSKNRPGAPASFRSLTHLPHRSPRSDQSPDAFAATWRAMPTAPAADGEECGS